MNLHRANGRWVVWLSFICAMLLQIMPLPAAVEAWRPAWLLLVISYWAMALPHRYNILTAWLLGMGVDILLGSHLGVHSLSMSIMIYAVVLHFQRLRNFPMWQQALMLAAGVGCYQILIFWVQVIIDEASFNYQLFFPMLSSLFIWPWVFWILRRVRRQYKVR